MIVVRQQRLSRHNWLWLLFGLWLTLFETALAVHAVEEGIDSQHHGHCLLCKGDLHQPVLLAMLPIVRPSLLPEFVVLTADYVAPYVVATRRVAARSPPTAADC